MPLDKTFGSLCAQCLELRDALLGLRLTAVEDRPQPNTVALVDALGDSVEEMVGRLQEMLYAATEAHQAVQPPSDIEQARKALAQCQDSYIYIASRFETLVAYEQMAELVRLGCERGRQWRKWTDTVRQALEYCRTPSNEVRQALFQCWQEVAERAGTVSVSVRGAASVPAQDALEDA